MFKFSVCKHTDTVKGYGTYAREELAKDTIVWIEPSDIRRNICTFQPEELQQMKPEMKQRVFRYGTVLDDGKVEVNPYLISWVNGETDEIKLEDISTFPSNIDFINHSCEPNLVWEGSSRLVARRHIRAGEELTYDYRTEDYEVAPFQCCCGAETCCIRLGGQEWRKKEVQEKYARNFQDCILKYM